MPNMSVCPLCKKENEKDSSICNNCGFDLNPTFMPESDGIPDWLTSFRDESINNEGESDDLTTDQLYTKMNDEEEPDWLARIRERKSNDEENNSIKSETEFENITRISTKNTDELVGSFRTEDHEILEKENETDGLIIDLRKFQEDSAFENSQDAFSLDALSENSEKVTEKEEPDTIGDDWISRLKNSGFINIEDVSSGETEKTKNESLPDWLPPMNLDVPEEKQTLEQSEENYPGWMTNLRSVDENTPERSGQIQDDKLPEWIQQDPLSEENTPTSKNLENEEYQFQEGIISRNKLETEDAIIPDWISDADTSKFTTFENENINNDENFGQVEKKEEETFENEIASINPFITETPDEEEFKFLEKDIKAEISDPGEKIVQPENFVTSPFLVDNIPDWLGNEDEYISTNFFEDHPADNVITEETGQEIVPGDLPSWLKAMRPLEAVAPIVSRTKENKQIEKSGPLAGLQGVLTSHSLKQIGAPPPIQSLTVDITEKQKNQIDILNKLFDLENEPQKIEKPKSDVFEKIIQKLIPTLLILTLIYAYYFSNSNFSNPTIYPAETVRFASIVNGLILNQDTSPNILAIMEADGASLAEISIITNSVLDRLMIKNSYLSIISTNPNGSLLASNLIQKVGFASTTFNYDNNVTNFGYLPGGQNGIQSFIQSPKETINFDSNNVNIWDEPGLANISTFSQFDAILIITDDADASRIWIEQIRLLKPQTTILVAATTQAIPLLKPYVDSNQIDGMIGGLYGSTSYSDLIQSEQSNIELYWDMEKAGIYFFICILIVGGIAQVIIRLFGRKANKKQGNK